MKKNTRDQGCISAVTGYIGCCQPGLKRENYHPGRYYNTEYNFVRGWWTCCSQGWNSNGCVKLRLLPDGNSKNLMNFLLTHNYKTLISSF